MHVIECVTLRVFLVSINFQVGRHELLLWTVTTVKFLTAINANFY